MNFEYFIARKVAASGQKSFSRLIIRIAIAGIVLSMAVMIIATALIRGFKSEITTKIFGFWGHIHITDINVNNSFEETPLDMNQEFAKGLDSIQQIKYFAEISSLKNRPDGHHLEQQQTNGGINHVQIFATKKGVIKTKDEIEAIILKGIWHDFDWEFLKKNLVDGRIIELPDTIASKDILISNSTAKRLKLKVGDRLQILFAKDNQQLKRAYKVCGIYKTGLEEYDKRFALVDLRQVQRLQGWNENQVTGFEVFIDDIDDLEVIRDYLYYEKLPRDLYPETIRRKFPSIFEWLELQNINEVVIILLMLIVSIINMITALMILILERTNMIGILKALGQHNWSIRRIFLYYAAYIIGLGMLFGNILGLSICFLQDQFGFITLQEEDYYLSVAPIELNFWMILILNIGTLCITVIFLIIPSYLVTRISPVKAIRFK